jgi:hypothetical protein
MFVATQKDECIQKHAHLQIYNPVHRKVRKRSLVGGTRVMCSMMAGLDHLPLPSVQRLNISGFSHKEQQFISVATNPGTWHRCRYELVVSFASAGHNTPFSKIGLLVSSIWIWFLSQYGL